MPLSSLWKRRAESRYQNITHWRILSYTVVETEAEYHYLTVGGDRAACEIRNEYDLRFAIKYSAWDGTKAITCAPCLILKLCCTAIPGY